MGFGVPLDRWFRGELKDELRAVLLDPVALDRGLFRPEAVETLIDDHIHSRRDKVGYPGLHAGEGRRHRCHLSASVRRRLTCTSLSRLPRITVMHEVQGVIARSKGAPVELTTILVPDPGPGEALVKVASCGVCHTDLHYREGGINDDFPFLLGHEAAGVVEAVGDDVRDLAVGDFVILNWRAVCGDCRACRARSPLVLLQHPQRQAEDDAARWHAAVARTRHWGVRARRRWWPQAMHKSRSDGEGWPQSDCSAAA